MKTSPVPEKSKNDIASMGRCNGDEENEQNKRHINERY